MRLLVIVIGPPVSVWDSKLVLKLLNAGTDKNRQSLSVSLNT